MPEGVLFCQKDPMPYKMKPNKAIAKRFKVTAKGKLKRHHSLTSHLRSARSAKKKRHLRRPEITFEGIARNMRRLMGISKSPGKSAKRRTKVSSGGGQSQN
jgi:large subunit ribosomal protein L35